MSALPDYSEYLLDAGRALRETEEAGRSHEWVAMARAADAAAGSCVQAASWARRQEPRRVEHWNRTRKTPECDLVIELGAECEEITRELRAARAGIDAELAAELADIGKPRRPYSRRELVAAFLSGVVVGVVSLLLAAGFL